MGKNMYFLTKMQNTKHLLSVNMTNHLHEQILVTKQSVHISLRSMCHRNVTCQGTKMFVT